MSRFIIIVLDGVGVGELPDAHEYNDEGSNTLNNTRLAVGDLKIPNLEKLGIYNIDGTGLPAIENPIGCYGKCNEENKAKDSSSGHFEIAGLIVKSPYKVFGESFPPRIMDELERRIGVKTIGNFQASGTEIIKDLGDEHVRTGYPIVYLAADSLMQIAMHVGVIPLERQYEICQIARELLMGDDTVARIICRPFDGVSGAYFRTEDRRDFSVDPPGDTVLDLLKEKGKDVIAVGKIEDLFNKKGITEVDHTKNNHDGIISTIEYLKKDFNGLLFTNLVDFDMLYGHRNNPDGFARALEYFDSYLPEIMSNMREDDILIITADHGNDPTTPSTDHSREYIPVVAYGKKLKTDYNIGTRATFADIGQTVADYFGYKIPSGTSFLDEILK